MMLKDSSISLVSEQIHTNNQLQKIRDPSRRQSSTTRSTNLRAYIYATISSISIVISQINLKKLTHHFQPTLILGVRGTLLFLSNLIYFIYTNKQYHMKDPIVFRAILKRAIFSTLTLIMYLGSVKFLPLGIVNSLYNTVPIMTFFLDIFYYKKNEIHWFNLLMILISFTGVLFIIQPPFLFGGTLPDNYFMYFVVLGSAVTGTLSIIFLHDLRGRVDQLVVLMHGYFIQGMGNYIIYIIIHRDDSRSIQFLHNLTLKQGIISLVQLLVTVLFAFMTQYFLAKAAYLCSPALIMPFSYISVIVGFVIDILLFDAQYTWLMMIGMVMASIGLFSKFVALYLVKSTTNKPIQNNKK